MEPLLLSRALYDQIVAEARAGKPEEICGIVRGRGNRAVALYPGRNVADDRINNYTVDPLTLLKQFEFEETGDEMIGIYHSHPISEAYPSATDAWNAYYPDTYTIICSLEDDASPVVRVFQLLTQILETEKETVAYQIDFSEVRPSLFGYYQPETKPLPAVLTDLAAAIPRPFYLVYDRKEGGALGELRIVQVVEYPVQIWYDETVTPVTG